MWVCMCMCVAWKTCSSPRRRLLFIAVPDSISCPRADLGVGPRGLGPPFVFYLIFQHYMFNMEFRHLLTLSVQNALDCISENFNPKHFPGGTCPRNSLGKCADRSPDRRYRAHIATVYYIARLPLSRNPSVRPLCRYEMLSGIACTKP